MKEAFEQYNDSDASQQVELDFYYAAIRMLKPKVCVEVGTHRGLSGLYMAEAIKDNGVGHLHTCDPLDFDQRKTFADQGFADIVTFYKTESTNLDIKDIDFLFLDGCHDRESVLLEMGHFFPNLTPGAMVIFHDASWAGGVNDAAAEVPTFYVATPNGLRIYLHK